MLWCALPSLLVVVIAIWWMARTAVAPLTALAAEARRVSIGTLDSAFNRGAGDQLDAVATAFNETLARLEVAVGEMRQFSSALAHELRTPLTALRGEIELALLQSQTDGERQRRATSQMKKSTNSRV
jgi:signal transduction histidine kinase